MNPEGEVPAGGKGFALVTGASRGIGERFARALAARGTDLVLAARSKDALDHLARELSAAHGISVEPIEIDLAAEGAASTLADELSTRGLNVDLLVNNAGFGLRGRFWELPIERQIEMLRLNVEALVELTYRLLPAMIERGDGAVINVASLAGFQAVPYASAYAATKAFVTDFSMSLREEVRRHNVRVVTLCPGRTRVKPPPDGRPQKLGFGESSPEQVVAAALRKLDKGGGLVVPGGTNGFALFMQRFFPRDLVARAAGALSKP